VYKFIIALPKPLSVSKLQRDTGRFISVASTVLSESRCALRLWLSVSKLPLKCAAVLLYSVVKQLLKCNTGKVCNCLIQLLLTIILSIKQHVFLVEYVIREGNRYTDIVQEQFPEKFPETPLPHRNAVRRLIEKFRGTGSVSDALGHHFQHLL
jgi:hypothetical protein